MTATLKRSRKILRLAAACLAGQLSSPTAIGNADVVAPSAQFTASSRASMPTANPRLDSALRR